MDESLDDELIEWDGDVYRVCGCGDLIPLDREECETCRMLNEWVP